MQSVLTEMSEVFFALCKSIDSPVSLGAWLRFKYSQNELASMDIDPRHYIDAKSFQDDYAVVSFLSKWKGLSTGLNLPEIAIQSFKLSEDACRETNARLRDATSCPSWLSSVLYTAKWKIASLLGPASTFATSDLCDWGPGATFELPRRRAWADTKVCELPITVSRSARSMLRNEIEQDLHWSYALLGVFPEGPYCLLDSTFQIEDHCRVTTVPKSAKTDRTIAVEPRGNSFLQKGVGAYIRKKLRMVGIDLNDQTRNQQLARQAYFEDLSTLDLKSASDTMSVELVWALLPYDWASTLDALRSRRAILPDGSSIVLNKFSSMGNGFTFELETLIFWALAQSVIELSGSRGVLSVYGDDVIVSRNHATSVCLAYQYCGFTVNDKKSYLDGNFFESCGKHYFQGIDVTPTYQKELIDTAWSAVRLGNRLIRLAFKLGRERFLDLRVRGAWLASQRLSVAGFRDLHLPFGSEGDDGWLHPYSTFIFRSVDRNMGVECKVIRRRPSSYPAIEEAILAVNFRRRRNGGLLGTSEFLGNIDRDDEHSKLCFGKRWIVPTGTFSADWR